VQEIEQAQPEIFDRFQKCGYPFDGAWQSWQHDTSWIAPHLPEDWKMV
jgi:hypothetical protein